MNVPRKALKMQELLDISNGILLNSRNELVEFRTGVTALLECLLSESNNYGGYRMLLASDMPSGYTPGARIKQFAHMTESGDSITNDRMIVIDDTRRRYSLKKS